MRPLAALNPFLRQRNEAVVTGIKVVRKILAENSFPNGFTTKELYALARKEPAPEGFTPFFLDQTTDKVVPHPEHPVRSIRCVLSILKASSTTYLSIFSFLKEDILAALSKSNEIQMKPSLRTPNSEGEAPVKKKKGTSSKEFKWRVIPPEERPQPEPKPWEKSVVGREVGVGADVGHLNKRRQRARIGKVSAAVLRMKERQQKLGDAQSVSDNVNVAQ